MKAKILIVILAIASALCLTLGLSGCAGCNKGENETVSGENTEQGGIVGGDENCRHKWGSWTTVSGVACTEKGSEERLCSVCGGKETRKISALGHSFDTNNVCTRCGFNLAPTAGLVYELIEEKNSGYYTVTGLDNSGAGEIVIPAYHAEKPVTRIADGAFYGNDFITSVYLTGNIEKIGKNSFYSCKNLSGLTISTPSNSLIIDEMAFFGCDKLINISLPDKISEINFDSFEDTGYYNDKNNWKNGVLIADGWVLNSTKQTATSLKLDYTAKGIANNALFNSNITSIDIETSVSCTEKSFATSKITSATVPSDLIGYLPKNRITELNITSGNLAENILSGCGNLGKLIIPSLSDGAKYDTLHFLFGRTQYQGAVEVKRLRSVNNGYETESTPYYLPESLKEVTVMGGDIVDYSFSGIRSVTKINIGSEVQNLGEYICLDGNERVVLNFTDITAFLSAQRSGVYNYLKSGMANREYTKVTIDNQEIVELEIPAGTKSVKDYLFTGCTNLKSVTVPDSVSSIGDGAFQDCTSLKSVTIGNGVIYIGNTAFFLCKSLESIKVADGNTAYSSQDGILYNKDKTEIIIVPKAIKGSVTIPNGVTSIDNYTFSDCKNLESVIIPDSVASIGYEAFYNCTILTSVTIPNSVSSIGEYAFYGCYKLAEVVNLSSLPITKGNSDCGYVAKYAKDVYNTAEFESKIKTQGDYIFYEDGETVYLLGYKGTATELQLPESLNGKNYGIYQCAFYHNDKITSITIPNGVISIGYYAFNGCESLTSVTFENTAGWKVSDKEDMSKARDFDVTDPDRNSNCLKFYNYYWKRYDK